MSFYHRYCGQHHDYSYQARDCEENTLMGRDRRPGTEETQPRRVSPASGPRAQVPATPPQVRFIQGLYEERRVPVGGETPREAELLERGFDILGWRSDEYDAEHDKFVSKAEASDVITQLKLYPFQESPKARKGSVAPQGNQDEVPAGRFALQGDDGVVRFYQVDKPEDGRWKGYTFVKILIGSPGDWRKERLNRSLQPTILSAIAADVAGALRLYGQKTEHCGACNSPLSTTRSRAAGYGQKCADTHGLWYPSEAEARAILNEMAGAGAK